MNSETEKNNAICSVVKMIKPLKEASQLIFHARLKYDTTEIANAACLEIAEIRIKKAIEQIKYLKEKCGMYDK